MGLTAVSRATLVGFLLEWRERPYRAIRCEVWWSSSKGGLTNRQTVVPLRYPLSKIAVNRRIDRAYIEPFI
ncbi:hypothetical protein SeMB42_g03465 [Synchytrium endobioticum]|uniref:Uncharacterized protein n=1 Tax=Synchytrium endobioticum TaxID=286115 RepID=A0A507D738_9FUNG|nr:hypothetical protein SeMB42_g03465 [Synchytrium endobioticum]